MADLPAGSDEGALEVVNVDPGGVNKLNVASNGSLQTFADITNTGTIAALNGAVTVNVHGCANITFNITGTWVATLTFEGTTDGTNWFAVYGNQVSSDETVQFVTGNTAVSVSCGGLLEVRVIATAYTSGTADIAWDAGAGPLSLLVISPVAASFNTTVTQAAGTWTDNLTEVGGVAVAATAKGTQGTNFIDVQEAKDTGRTYVTFTADAIAGVTTEALVSFTQNRQGTTTAAVTSYTVTSGKTLRIQSITAACQSGSALAEEWVRVKIRHNTAGATTATSALVYTVSCGTNVAAAAAVNNIHADIPDGLEIYGNGTQSIGVSHLSSATTNVESITLCGYEY
jgi:hypothetical protein